MVQVHEMFDIEIATREDLKDIKKLLESVEIPSDEIDAEATTFFVMRDDSSRIIACIGLELFTDAALITSFAVDPTHLGDGLGATLVDKSLEEAMHAGSEAVYLCTAQAPELFQNIGFVNIDRDELPQEIRGSYVFKNDCPFVAAYMKKSTY